MASNEPIKPATTRALLLHSVTLSNFKTNMLQLLQFGKRKTNNTRSPQNLEQNPKTTKDLILHQTKCLIFDYILCLRRWLGCPGLWNFRHDIWSKVEIKPIINSRISFSMVFTMLFFECKILVSTIIYAELIHHFFCNCSLSDDTI